MNRMKLRVILAIVLSFVMMVQFCAFAEDSVTIKQVDAYKKADGTGALRFITEVTSEAINNVTSFGTWLVSGKYLEHLFDSDPSGDEKVKQLDSTTITNKVQNNARFQQDENGKYYFTADLMNIPAEYIGMQIYGKSYIKYNDSTTSTSGLASTNVNQIIPTASPDAPTVAPGSPTAAPGSPTPTQVPKKNNTPTYYTAPTAAPTAVPTAAPTPVPTPEPTPTPIPYASFDKVFPHTDTYLYRVGNANNVALSSLFAQAGSVAPTDVTVTITKIDGTAAGTYTKNSTTWNAGTVKFTGNGVVKTTIQDGSGTPTDLYLEVVDGKNVATSTISSSTSSLVLLNDVALSSSTSKTTFSGNKIYGNGFVLDATAGGAITANSDATKEHGIIEISSTTLDNLVIYGPAFTSYVGTYKSVGFASTVAVRGNSVISNCYITNASSPLKIMDNATIENTVLSGGVFANLELYGSSKTTLKDVTTINSAGLGIVFGSSSATDAKLTINGTLTQHNFISQNTSLSGDAAKTLKDKMFSSSYSQYQFTANGTKYINSGIISMGDYVQDGCIVDNRSNKRNYQGTAANVSILTQTVHGYVYTMTNADSSMLETSYTEPTYTPSAQRTHEPVITPIALGNQATEQDDTFCRKKNDGIEIQFLQGNTFTLDAAALRTVTKYGTHTITPTVTCTDGNGTSVPVTSGKITFEEAGDYTIYYNYSDSYIYNQNGTLSGQTVNYSEPVNVKVYVKKVGKTAVITASTTSETMIWGKAGGLGDVDYQPAAPIFTGMTITDYYDDGTAYTVLDGSNQTAFLNSILSVTADSDNKTGFTITLADGTTIAIKCGAPYNSGTLVFKKNSNKFYMCGSVAYNNATAATWNVTSYTYTGRNGVAVTYAKRSFTSTTSTSTVSLSNLSTNKFLIYKLNGGELNTATYTSTSPATLPTPTREGYVFKGWDTKEDGTGTRKQAGTSYSFSSTTTLYAQWIIPSTVTFNANGGTCATASATNETGDITLPDATNGSMTFEGWYDDPTGGNKIGKAGDTYDPTGDITLYAHWSNKLKVTFNANGGSSSDDEIFFEPSDTAITLPTATRTGYTFNGWYTATSGGTKAGNAGASYTPTANITLYAQWTVNTYTVTIKAGSNGSVSPTSVANVPYNTTVTESSNTLTINGIKVTATATDGYEFSSWSNKPSKITSNVTITANFTKKSGGCFAKGTQITMADGSTKAIENVAYGDRLLAWDFFGGSTVPSDLALIVNEGTEVFKVSNLSFTDGSTLRLIADHGLFDFDLNRFVYIDDTNCEEFVGHHFVKNDTNGGYELVTMVDAYVTTELTTAYSLTSAGTMNAFANNLLTVAPPEDFYNWIPMSGKLRYDTAQFEADVQKYGLYTYDDFKDYVTYEQYLAFNGPYLKVPVEKGIFTYDAIIELIDQYLK